MVRLATAGLAEVHNDFGHDSLFPSLSLLIERGLDCAKASRLKVVQKTRRYLPDSLKATIFTLFPRFSSHIIQPCCYFVQGVFMDDGPFSVSASLFLNSAGIPSNPALFPFFISSKTVWILYQSMGLFQMSSSGFSVFLSPFAAGSFSPSLAAGVFVTGTPVGDASVAGTLLLGSTPSMLLLSLSPPICFTTEMRTAVLMMR